jgi:hypothetical protein
VQTRFIVTDLTWRRLILSKEFGWWNLVLLLPIGLRGEHCRSVFREKTNTDCSHIGARSERVFRLSPVLPDLQ